MSEIEEAVAKAMKDSLIEQGVWMQREEQGGVVAIQVDGHVDFEALARAAIEAYEKHLQDVGEMAVELMERKP